MSRIYAAPHCCDLAGTLIMWLPANKKRGPEKSGWCIRIEYAEDHTAKYYNAVACPFCGERFMTNEG